MKRILLISLVVLVLDAALVHEKQSSIFATRKEHKAFFHLFKVQYVVCFFASKGKWPFIPPMQQVKVDQVSRSIFPQSDSFIQNFCKNWMPVSKCHRPMEFTQNNVSPAAYQAFPVQAGYPIPPAPAYEAIPQPAALQVTDVTPVTVKQSQKVTPIPLCACTPLPFDDKVEAYDDPEVIYFDKKHIGNITTDTILNTIEFLESFVLETTSTTTTTKKPKRRIKNRVKN